MTGTKKKKRIKKNKSNKPKAGKSKAGNPQQDMTADTAFGNLDAVCSKFMGTRGAHINLQLSIAMLKGKVKALDTAEARIKELEEELADAEAGYEDDPDPDDK